MTADLLLSLSGIKKSYGDVHALEGVDLELNAGEMLALLGHNGAGKTTLMKIILGLLAFDAGQASVMGVNPGHANHQIGYVPENVSFYPSLSATETLLFFARLNGLAKHDAKKIVTELLETVHLADAADRSVKTYSKGMRQRLGLAQALLPSSLDGITNCEPKLLILDEPTVGLDPVATAEFFQLLKQLQQSGCGIIICTHVLPGLEQFIDKALVLNKGRMVASGAIQQLYIQANLPVTVKPIGLNGSLKDDITLQSYLHADGYLSVPFGQKLEVIQYLLNQTQLTDIQVNNPSFPELYQHLIGQQNEVKPHAQ